MIAAGFGEFHLTAERTVFMDNRRIEGGGGRDRGNTGTKGWFRGKMVRGIGVGRSHIWAFYKRKRSIQHTHTYTHTGALTA